MDGTRPRPPVTDSQLDAEIESALGVNPSPEFLARVRTRIAVEPQPARWRLALLGKAVEPLAGVAIVGIVLAIVVPRWMREEQPARLPTSAEAPASRKANFTPDAFGRSGEAGLTRAVRQPVVQVGATPLPLSRPLFPEDDRRLMALLLSAVEQGRMAPMPVAGAPPDQPGEPLELRIEPLVIEPLPQLASAGQALEQVEGERE